MHAIRRRIFFPRARILSSVCDSANCMTKSRFVTEKYCVKFT